MYKLLTVIILFVGCSNAGVKDPSQHEDDLSDIIKKKEQYLELMKSVQDEYGAIDSDHCDSLLWSSLVAYGGAAVDIDSFRDQETGQWFRTPYKDCYRNHQLGNNHSRKSGSTISKDMFVGLVWLLYHNGDNGRLRLIWEYGKSHDWVMGDGPLSRVLLTTNLVRTLALTIEEKEPILPDVWVVPDVGFERHLLVLHLLLRGDIQKELSSYQVAILKKVYDDEPGNGLFAYAYHRWAERDSDQREAIKILSNLSWFPDDRLPTNNDRCEGWIWQRALDDKGLKPCPKERVHSGGEFVFLAKLLEDAAFSNGM